MKATRRIGRVIKPFVNFPRWMGLSMLLANGKAIVNMLKEMKIYRPAIRSESFEQAKQRLRLTDEDIKSRIRNCLILSVIYYLSTLAFLLYTLYMIFHGCIGMIVGLLITILMAVFAYREHFWYFQLKTRSLGNSFHDWVAYVLGRRRK